MPHQMPSPLPSSFLALFSERGLSVPPVPALAALTLRQVEVELFATGPDDDYWEMRPDLPLDSLRLGESLPAPAEEKLPENPFDRSAAMFLCGFTGTGLQNGRFRYIYSGPRLHMGLVLPYGCVYGDPEAEKQDIASGLDLLRTCLLCTDGGGRFGRPDVRAMYWSSDMFGTRYCLLDENGEVVVEGEGVEGLLDELDSGRRGAAEENSRKQSWIKI